MIPVRLRQLLLGLAVFMVVLLPQLPASLVAVRLADAVPENIRWQQVTGTLFHPVLHQLQIDAPAGFSPVIDRVDLHIAVLPLLIGRLDLDFELVFGPDRIVGRTVFTPGRWRDTRVQGGIDVSNALRALLSSGIDLAEGRLGLDVTGLGGRYEGMPDSGDIILTLERFRPIFNGTGEVLGDYRLHLRASAETGLSGRLETRGQDARLLVDADIRLEQGTRVISIEGLARARAASDTAVQSLLPLLGPIDNGVARIAWRGRW